MTYRYDKVRSADDAAAFLGQFGWVVDAGSAETAQVTIPAEFDKVFAGYNELQKQQGLDLSKYRNRSVTRYTFAVTNYDGWQGSVYANVLVYRNRVIGGDICSADVSGFIHGFEVPAQGEWICPLLCPGQRAGAKQVPLTQALPRGKFRLFFKKVLHSAPVCAIIQRCRGKIPGYVSTRGTAG